MSDRIDRRIENNNLLVVVIVIFCIAGAVGIFAWQRLNISSQPEPAVEVQTREGQVARTDEPLTIMMYYPVRDALVAGPVPVPRKPDVQSEARDVLLAVFADSRSAISPLFSQVKLREFFLDDSGTAYVDLQPVSQNGIQASGGEELLAIYAMVNTLMQNYEDIKQVRFLLDGKEVQTLAGHIDFSRTFDKRMDLVRQQ